MKFFYKLLKQLTANLSIFLEIFFAIVILTKYTGNFWLIKSKLHQLNEDWLKKRYLRAYNIILFIHGSWIGYNSYFKEKPKFPHGMKGFFVSQGAKIGRGCVIFHHVTIGSNTLDDSKGRGLQLLGIIAISEQGQR